VSIKVAEMAVAIRRLTDRFTSKHLVYAAPTGRLLADIRAPYGPQVFIGSHLSTPASELPRIVRFQRNSASRGRLLELVQ
jgi:hypothetical protein